MGSQSSSQKYIMASYIYMYAIHYEQNEDTWFSSGIMFNHVLHTTPELCIQDLKMHVKGTQSAL